MRKFSLIILIALSAIQFSNAQDEWHIEAKNIDPTNYFGVTVANGMIGIVSSANPLQVKDVVLNGAFDTYGRGRVSNIMKVFSFANMYLEVDGKRLERKDITNYSQILDMQNAALATSFDYGTTLSVKHEIMALRHLPHTALINLTITAKKDCEIIPASIIESPDNLKEVKNFYSEIDRPHIVIPLMTSVAKSPTGKLTLACSNSFLFNEGHGKEPHVIHEEWDNNMHLLKFKKKLKAGESYSFSVVGSVISTAHKMKQSA
jgi:protein-glucosylgalactosylhydroxylysine glucosidase